MDYWNVYFYYLLDLVYYRKTYSNCLPLRNEVYKYIVLILVIGIGLWCFNLCQY